MSKMTFAKIAPKWNKLIKKRGFPDELGIGQFKVGKQTLELSQMRSCIVGEAHGFKSLYQCSVCGEFSMVFYGLTKSNWEIWHFDHDRELSRYKKKPTFEQVKSDFVKHWNEVHVK